MQDGDATGPGDPAETIANATVAQASVDSPSAGSPADRVWVHRDSTESDTESGTENGTENGTEETFTPGDLTDVEAEWDRLEELPGAEVIKSNLSRQVISLPATDRRAALIVKRYRVRGRSERLKYRFLPSRAAREWRALLELENAGFPTPRPIAMFEEKEGRWLRGAGLVMELLEEVYPAPDLVFADPSGEPARDELLQSCGRIVARLHRQGIAHPDLHLGNFLGNPDDSTDVRLVDLHAVHHKKVVGSPRRRSDLAKLIHSLGSDVDRHSIRQVLEAYLDECAASGRGVAGGTFLGELEEEIDLVWSEARELERIRLKSRDRRCWGTTSQFIVESKDAWRIHRRREFSPESLAPLLDGSWSALRTLREIPGERVCEVELPTESGPTVFTVETCERSLLAGITDRFIRGPLERAWGAARRFEVRGFSHLRAYALLIERSGGRTVRTLLVSEKRSGKSLADAVVERSADPRERSAFLRRAIDTVAPLLREMHRAGIYHGDASPENWLVEEVEPAGSAVLLADLAAIHPSQRPSLARRRQNLLQLAMLPEGGATLAERLRFLIRYHDGERIFPAWLRDLDAAFGEMQVGAIEERIARERGEPSGSSGSSGSKPSTPESSGPEQSAPEKSAPESSPPAPREAADADRAPSFPPPDRRPLPPTVTPLGASKERATPSGTPVNLSPLAKDGDDRSTAD